jgi:hypothetical protein
MTDLPRPATPPPSASRISPPSAGRSSFADEPPPAAPPLARSAVVGALAAPPLADSAEAAPSVPSALDREVVLLDEARRHLGRGQPSAALATLAKHGKEISAPMLGREATLLRVQALVASGARREAQRVVEGTLAARPVDGYACRMAHLAGLHVRECSSRP